MTPPAASAPSPTVEEERELTRTQFITAMAAEIARVGVLSPSMALTLARRAYHEFEETAGVKFGHSDFAWDQGAARTIAREYEIDHWETSP